MKKMILVLAFIIFSIADPGNSFIKEGQSEDQAALKITDVFLSNINGNQRLSIYFFAGGEFKFGYYRFQWENISKRRQGIVLNSIAGNNYVKNGISHFEVPLEKCSKDFFSGNQINCEIRLFGTVNDRAERTRAKFQIKTREGKLVVY